MITANDVLQRGLHIVASLFIRHIEKGNAVKIDSVSDVGMVSIAVEQSGAVAIPKDVWWKRIGQRFADCPAPGIIAFNQRLHYLRDREMKCRQDRYRCSRVRAAIGHKRHIAATRRRSMFGVITGIPHGVAAIRLDRASRKSFRKDPGPVGGKERPDADRFDQSDVRDPKPLLRPRRCLEDALHRLFLDDLVTQKRREGAKGMEKRRFKQP